MKTFNKFNLFKSFKYVLISFATLILAGVIVLCCCSFNLGVEFSGGSKFSVEPVDSNLISDSVYKTEFVDNQKTIINEVEDILEKEGLSGTVVQIQGEGNDQTISFVFKNKKGVHKDDLPNFNDDLKVKIEQKLSTISEEVDFKVNGVEAYSSSVWNNWWVEGVALCVVLIAVFVYFAVRFFPFGAITTMLGILIDSITVLSVFALTRIQLTKFVGCAILVSIVLGCIYQILIFSKIKESYLAGELGDKTNKEITDSSIKKSTTTILILSSLVALVGFVMMFVNLEFGLYLVIPTLISTISSLFISPVLFGIIAKKKRFIPTFNKINR